MTTWAGLKPLNPFLLAFVRTALPPSWAIEVPLPPPPPPPASQIWSSEGENDFRESFGAGICFFGDSEFAIGDFDFGGVWCFFEIANGDVDFGDADIAVGDFVFGDDGIPPEEFNFSGVLKAGLGGENFPFLGGDGLVPIDLGEEEGIPG
jgi:hypothetical protein